MQCHHHLNLAQKYKNEAEYETGRFKKKKKNRARNNSFGMIIYKTFLTIWEEIRAVLSVMQCHHHFILAQKYENETENEMIFFLHKIIGGENISG